MEYRRTRIGLAVVLVCLLSLAAWLGVSQMTTRADDTDTEQTASADIPVVQYYEAEDCLYVYSTDASGEARVEDYIFYTTASAATKVPAVNKWYRTREGFVPLSNITSATTLYFAKSTQPAIDEIVAVQVPGVPKFSKIKYNPVAANSKYFTVTMKYSYWVKNKSKTKTATVDDLNQLGYADWVYDASSDVYSRVNLTNSEIDELVGGWQEEGETITLYTPSSIDYDASGNPISSVVEVTDLDTANNKIVYRLAGTKRIGSEGAEESLQAVRVASKTYKVTKKATGPAVTIDYVNHAFKVTGKQQYVRVDTEDEMFEDSADREWTTGNGGKVYDETPNAADYYLIRTAATSKKAKSLSTYLYMPADTALADDALVSISGTTGSDAYLSITDKNWNDTDNKVAAAFQYAIVSNDSAMVKAADGKDAYFNYKAAGIKWTSAKTNKKTGTVTVKLAKSKLTSASYVYVRKAAVTKTRTYSSKVEIFRKPTAASETDMTASANATNLICWSKLTQDDYGEHGFDASNFEHIQLCPYVNVTYAGNRVFDVTAYGAESYDNDAAGAFKVGKTAVTAKNISVDTESRKITAVLDAANALSEKSSLTAKITVPEGFATASADAAARVSNASYVISLTKLDTQAPAVVAKITKAAGLDITITFNEEIALRDANGEKVTSSELSSQDASGNALKLDFGSTVNGQTASFGKAEISGKTIKITGIKPDTGTDAAALWTKATAKVTVNTESGYYIEDQGHNTYDASKALFNAEIKK